MSYKIQAYVQSLNIGKATSTEKDEITVLEEIGNNLYKVEYRGVLCTAIFNYFNCSYYADDVYGRIKE